MLPIEKKQHLQSLSDKCTLQACPSTGSNCPEVSECYLFSVKLDFEKAKSSHYLQKCR